MGESITFFYGSHGEKQNNLARFRVIYLSIDQLLICFMNIYYLCNFSVVLLCKSSSYFGIQGR